MEKDKNNYFIVTIDDNGIITRHAAERINNTSLVDVITNEDLLSKNIIGIESCVEKNYLDYNDDKEAFVRDLIYYDSYGPTGNVIGGRYTFRFGFISLMTDEFIELYENQMFDLNNRDANEYNDIKDATKDYDILWEIDNRGIDCCARYEEVKEAYNKLVEIGFKDEVLNELMMDKFTTKYYVNRLGKTKRLNRSNKALKNLR